MTSRGFPQLSVQVVMSKKIVFCPTLSLTWEESRKYEEDSTGTPEGGSEPESEGQVYYTPDISKSFT
jgi:hypothetical protein